MISHRLGAGQRHFQLSEEKAVVPVRQVDENSGGHADAGQVGILQHEGDLLFTAPGMVLTRCGLLAPHETMGICINLLWRFVMLLFGSLMTAAAMRSSPRSRRELLD